MMPRPSEPDLAVATERDIALQIAELRALASSGYANAALVLGWALLEALARRAVRDRLSKPQRPSSVLEMLAFEGYVSPSQADRIRPLIRLRNRLVHGDFSPPPDSTTVEDFVTIIDYVHGQIKQPEAA